MEREQKKTSFQESLAAHRKERVFADEKTRISYETHVAAKKLLSEVPIEDLYAPDYSPIMFDKENSHRGFAAVFETRVKFTGVSGIVQVPYYTLAILDKLGISYQDATEELARRKKLQREREEQRRR